ncbi:MAG: ABC transporter substrate-binding protein [Acidobacteria bacterium]|nr:ABC transporter substrate-binding protein [Acidobacteriota bacterium]
MRKLTLLLLIATILTTASTCRRRNADAVTVALPEKFSSFDTLTSVAAPDASAERVKSLIFNALVKKNEKFEYVGELAKEINTSADGLTITFVLQDNVKFHNGKPLTSADVKYTFDELLKTDPATGKAVSFKGTAFFDSVPVDNKADAGKSATTPTPSAPSANGNANTNANAAAKPAPEVKTKAVPQITKIETPDAKTIVFTVTRPALKNQLLSNLVAIPIVPEGGVGTLKDSPVGSGPYKFVSFDASQNIVELAANPDYWEGPPSVQKLRIKTVTDATALQAELQTGGVDIAPNPNNLPPDMLNALGGNPNLKLDQWDGSNIQYLVFNTASGPLANPKIRQAIAYAVDRQKIVKELLNGQAKPASSILPDQSWAYTPGTEYKFDPAKAKQLLQEAGYKGEPISFKYASGNAMINQYAQVIQSSLNDVGLNVQIETLEVNVIRQQLAQGQFQMYTGVWIGGNQDPIFLRDLFSSTKIPGGAVACCNRSRYNNPAVDKNVEDAINATDQATAKALYGKVWDQVSADVPLFPLWYPANIAIYNKRIGNIKLSGSGDWTFLKDITVSQ